MASLASVPLPIIDIHCHIASESFFPRSFLGGIVDNLAATLTSNGIGLQKRTIAALYAAKWRDPLCDQLIAEMDAAGIQKAVLLLPDFTFALHDCTLTIAEMIDHHRIVMQRHPGRLLVFAGVDPRWGQDGISLFEKSVSEYGFHGLKLYPPCGYSPADKALYPYYEICAALSLPVLTHIGATSPVLSFDEARPIYIDQAAKDFPGLDFILAHGSVHYVDECVMLCSHRPNVYIDVSGFEMSSLSNLRSLFQRGINHKILFGTDWPIFRLQGKQKDFIDRLNADDAAFPEGMTDDDKACFFSRNALRILTKNKNVPVTSALDEAREA